MQNTNKNTVEVNNAALNPSNNLWIKYFAYWPLFLLLLVAALAGAWAYLKIKTPLYEIKAAILIKDPKKGTEDTKSLEALNPLNSNKIIENELEILQSRTLMNDVVNKLNLYAPIVHKSRLRVVSAYSSCPLKVQFRNPEALSDTNNIPFVYNKGNEKVIINGKKYDLNTWIDLKSNIFKFIPNPNHNSLAKTDSYLLSFVQTKNIADAILSKLKVESASRNATILNLTYQDENPKRGEDILNELLSGYNNAIITNRNQLASNTLNFVDDRLSKVQRELDSIEHKDQQYKASKSAIAIPEQGKMYLANVGENDRKLSEINMQVAVLEQVENSLGSAGGKSGIVPSTLGINDPVLTQLLNKLYDLELQAETLKQTTAKNNPISISVTDQIQKIKPQIKEIIQNQKQTLLASKNNLQVTNASYSSTLQSLPEKERSLVEINRGAIVKNYVYSFLLQKREETALSFASTAVENSVIDRGQSSASPVSPKPSLIYAAAIFGALVLGIGSITAKETFNSKILFRHEIENLTSYPIIGEIGYNNNKNFVAINKASRTPLNEQFKRLRTAIILQEKTSKLKKILVTSSIENEGKSFVAANLALSLSSAGKKVVLVDLDLINSTISYQFDHNEEPGISSYLLEKSEPQEIIRQSTLNENLSIIPAGMLLNDSSELLLNDRLEKLFQHLDLVFDYIIVDSAPVNATTDAYILSSYCDATFYVIRHGFTPKALVEQLSAEYKANPLKNVSIVFNDVRSRGFGKKGYGYGYGYGYVSNYGSTMKQIKQSKEQYKLEFPQNKS